MQATKQHCIYVTCQHPPPPPQKTHTTSHTTPSAIFGKVPCPLEDLLVAIKASPANQACVLVVLCYVYAASIPQQTRTAQTARWQAKRFNASAADTLAVCGMALTAAVGAPNMLDLTILRVGRRDRAVANPENMLLPGEADLAALDAFWRARQMTLDEGIALQGIHALMENKGCMTPQGAAARRAAAQQPHAHDHALDHQAPPIPLESGRRRRLQETYAACCWAQRACMQEAPAVTQPATHAAACRHVYM